METIRDRKIKLGLIGCGRISQKHIEGLKVHSSNIELSSICDKHIEKLEKAKKETDCNIYTSLDEMIENEKLDLVSIATPNGTHAEIALKMLKQKINVITEKPMALSVSDAEQMIETAKINDVKLFVVHQNRLNDTIINLKQALDENRFGKIFMITSNVFWQRPQEYYDKDATWHGTKDMDGGAFMTQASHYVDLMQWVANANPLSVYSKLATLARKIETEDTGSSIIKWENGVLGSINMTVLTYPKNMEGSVTILGEKGTVKIGGVAMNKILHWEFNTKKPIDDEVMKSDYETESVYGFGHERYYENIVKVLRGEASPLVDGDEGIKSLKILCAILKSNETSEEVRF